MRKEVRELESDVVVIGAGLSGLTAAWRLLEDGYSVTVLEANSRIGGRIFGFRDGDRAIQMGGRWTGPGQDRIKALAAELEIDVVPNTLFSDVSFQISPGDKIGLIGNVATAKAHDRCSLSAG